MEASKITTTTLLDDLLQRDAGEVLDWVTSVRVHEQEPPRGVNWLGLAEAAGFNARRYASRVELPINRFSDEQQTVLRIALCVNQRGWARVEPKLQRWLDLVLPALQWAGVALASYDHLIRRASPRDRNSYQDSAMNLRASLISKVGAIPGHRVLDANEIVAWFFDHLRLTPQQARAEARAWKEGPDDGTQLRQAEKLRRLRRVKNRLTPIAVLMESGQLEPTPALRAWLEVREHLP